MNCCREIRRLDRSRDIQGSPRVLEEDPGRIPAHELRLDTIDLLRALDVLPDGAREVLVLFAFFGNTHDEIASILGIAPGTSKSQLSYARERLRERLNIAKGGRPND